MRGSSTGGFARVERLIQLHLDSHRSPAPRTAQIVEEMKTRRRAAPLEPPREEEEQQQQQQQHAAKSPRWKRGMQGYSLSFPRFTLPVLTPTSSFKRGWEVLGVILMVVNLLSYFNKGVLDLTYSYLPGVADLYFLADILVRFRTGYVDGKTGALVLDPGQIARRYLRGWFALDCVLSIPYHFLYRCWQNTASLRLWSMVTVKQRRPILSFFRNRQFRLEVLQQFRAFWLEKSKIQSALGLQPHKRSLPRRTLRLFLSLFRVGARVRTVVWLTSLVRTLHSAALSVRTVSVVSRMRSDTEDGDER